LTFQFCSAVSTSDPVRSAPSFRIDLHADGILREPCTVTREPLTIETRRKDVLGIH
jgi:hypothetical protein